VFNGTVEINRESGSYRNNLLINGCNSGKVIPICWDTIDYDMEYGLLDLEKKLVNFLDWYESWVDESIGNLK